MQKLLEARTLAGLYLGEAEDRATATQALVKSGDLRLMALTIRCLQVADQAQAPRRIRELCSAISRG